MDSKIINLEEALIQALVAWVLPCCDFKRMSYIPRNEESESGSGSVVSVWRCNTMDHSPPGSCFHGVLQANTLEWGAAFARGSSQPRDWAQASCVAGGFFAIWATRDEEKEKIKIQGIYSNNGQLRGCIFKQKMTTARKFILVGLDQEKSISSP